MGTRSLVLLILLVVLVAGSSAQQPPAETQSSEARQTAVARKIKEALEPLSFKAKTDIPAADNIFVEDGKLSDASYRAELKTHGKALKAGAVTKISSIEVMDFGVQIFFETDSCALIALTAKQESTGGMTVEDLVKLVRKSAAPLFEVIEAAGGEKPRDSGSGAAGKDKAEAPAPPQGA